MYRATDKRFTDELGDGDRERGQVRRALWQSKAPMGAADLARALNTTEDALAPILQRLEVAGAIERVGSAAATIGTGSATATRGAPAPAGTDAPKRTEGDTSKRAEYLPFDKPPKTQQEPQTDSAGYLVHDKQQRAPESGEYLPF